MFFAAVRVSGGGRLDVALSVTRSLEPTNKIAIAINAKLDKVPVCDRETNREITTESLWCRAEEQRGVVLTVACWRSEGCHSPRCKNADGDILQKGRLEGLLGYWSQYSFVVGQ